MEQKKLRIRYGEGILSLPKDEVVNSLSAADGFTLKFTIIPIA